MIIKLATVAVMTSASIMSAPLFYESFSNINALSGWSIINNSTPGGQTPEGWFQGSGVFLTPSGSPTSYVQANFENAGSPGHISTWLITPPLAITAGALMTFGTIAEDVPGFPDRLEVRWSLGNGADVGNSPFSVGQFNEVLLTINPGLADDGYPTNWTTSDYTFNAAQAGLGRIAFRYVVPDRTENGSTVALDFVAFVPEPGTVSLMLLGVLTLGIAAVRRRPFLRNGAAATVVLLSVANPSWSAEKALRTSSSVATKKTAGTAAQKVAIDPATGLPTRPSPTQPAPAARIAAPAGADTYINLPNGAVGRLLPAAELDFLVVEAKPDGSLEISHRPLSAGQDANRKEQNHDR
jgi:hypothetical protein